MQPLKTVVGNARIVGLGEATHGTREFFLLKHRLIEFLASEKGFTIFSIEANMPEAYRLNDFVLRGNGDPKQLLKGMYFWTWDTEEVLGLILWMRQFNQSGKGHIEFTGFDMQNPTAPMNTVQTFVAAQDRPYSTSLDPIYQDVSRMAARGQSGFGAATSTFPVKAVAGRHVRYSGYIKTEGISQGFAGLWWRVDGEKGTQPLAFDNMHDRGARGSTPWTRYEISLDVPLNATHINFGVLHAGNGTAWFDSLRVELDGASYTDPSPFDLDFESDTVRGFHAGGAGYEITLDKAVAHDSNQSLRSELASTQPSANEKLTDEFLAQRCAGVVEHLEASRPDFIRAGLTPEKIDWAIQNARLVLQYVQGRSGGKSRDESMAENVKWIADHNPDAKLVLWAHNGHVAHNGPSGFLPMGRHLHNMFGRKFVNFGFAFNEGSFRAVDMGKGLREFAVGPAPEGSLDRALAATGVPILALDLRQTPERGPVQEWLGQPHASRSIGAVYDDSKPGSFLVDMRAQGAFDVILFVDNTTPARANR